MEEQRRFISRLNAPVQKEVRDLFEFANPSVFEALNDDELAKHITLVRDKAYAIAPWPCMGRFRFLMPGAPQNQAYEGIIAHLKANPQAKVLDLGCCFGHDARQLLKDGVRPDQLVAADLLLELVNLGFEMFHDRKDQGHLRGVRWEKVDIFNEIDIEKIMQPEGYYAIYVGSFLHLFPLRFQQKAVAVLDKLLSKEPGSVVWGRQVGRVTGAAGTLYRLSNMTKAPRGLEDKDEPAYYHDEVTFRHLFDDIKPNGWQASIKVYLIEEEKGAIIAAGDGEELFNESTSDLAGKRRLAFALARK